MPWWFKNAAYLGNLGPLITNFQSSGPSSGLSQSHCNTARRVYRLSHSFSKLCRFCDCKIDRAFSMSLILTKKTSQPRSTLQLDFWQPRHSTPRLIGSHGEFKPLATICNHLPPLSKTMCQRYRRLETVVCTLLYCVMTPLRCFLASCLVLLVCFRLSSAYLLA